MSQPEHFLLIPTALSSSSEGEERQGAYSVSCSILAIPGLVFAPVVSSGEIFL